MVGDYLGAMRELDEFKNGSPTDEIIHEIMLRHSSNVRWDRELKNNLRRRKTVTYSANNVWSTQYRPFVKQRCYVDYVLVNNNTKWTAFSLRPIPKTARSAFRESDRPSRFPPSWSITMPDLNFSEAGSQCFPRYR